MPESKRRAGDVAGKPRGAQALVVALSEVVPRLAVTLPPVITACGALLAAMSDPPDMGRRK